MKVRAITPIRVSDDELVRRQERYRRLAPPDVEIDLVNLPDGRDTPWQLDTPTAIDLSNGLVLEVALATDPTRYDAVLPDCVLDPAVARVADEPVPIVGILRLATGYLHGLGVRFSAVTRNQAIGDELVARLQHYGTAGSFAGLDVLDLDFAAIADDDRWHGALAPARLRAGERGATAVVNGCSAVDLPEDEGGTAVLDPTRLALRLLGVAASDQLPLGHAHTGVGQ